MKKCVLFLVFFLLAPCVFAKYITVSVMPLSNNLIAEDAGEVNFSVSNLGDEPAYDMSLGLVSPKGFNSEKVYVGVMDNGTYKIASFKISVSGDVTPGEYYSSLVVQYADANGYPFSMVNPVKLIYQKPAQSRISGFMDVVEVSGVEVKTLKLVLNSNDDVSRDVSVALTAPNEISVDSPVRQVSVPAKGKAEVEFKVSSIGALPGSKYVVYAVVEYSDQLHYASAVRSNVGIVEKASIPSWAPIAVVVILVLAVIYLQLRKTPKKKKKGE